MSGPPIADETRVKRATRRRLVIATAIYLASSAVLAAWLMPAGRETVPIDFAAPRERVPWSGGPAPPQVRTLAIRQAKVWRPANPAAADLAINPPDPTGQLSQPLVRCRYLDGPANGTTPKFDCVLPDGEVVKVKYGRTGEIHAETAATRLLSALGFGADRMYLVPRVRCYGCVRSPFYTVLALDYVKARNLLTRRVPEDSYTDFDWPVIERRFDALELEDGDQDGWAWFELEPTDPSRGATRDERDALRVMAIVLAHWDNKASNQRLVCLSPARATTAACTRPFAYMQDLGASFGPNKVDLEAWRNVPVWTDAARCAVSMRQFPYSGGTFPDTTISEAGRQLIVRQLSAVTEPQLTALFAAARFPEFNLGGGAAADPHAWAAALLDKVRQIREAGPCPALS
jgi:hypothetical protein